MHPTREGIAFAASDERADARLSTIALEPPRSDDGTPPVTDFSVSLAANATRDRLRASLASPDPILVD
jgi:hypothetical protein